MERAFTKLSHGALTLVCVLALGILGVAGLSKPLGYRALVDHSDSMQPAIAAGDIVLTRVEPPRSAFVGDVISFQDPDRKGKLLTHRVVERRFRAGAYAFVTRGDANTGSERWSIDDQGSVGVMVARIPRAGYALAWLQDGPRSIVLILASALLLTGLLVRRVLAL